jgi:rhodanese-related sulfurtransferase
VTVDDMLARARSRLERVAPERAAAEVGDGALLIDIRSDSQRERDGVVPEAVYFPRNVLEWRCDPDCEARDPRVGDTDRRVIVMCDAGYASSLAAVSLQELGFERATDLEGGFQAWRSAGLPVEPADPPG